MTHACYERLSARDNLFLVAETRTNLMHMAALQIAETGGLRTPEGGIDAPRIARALAASLHRIPRYRQKLKDPRFGGRPVWVDAEKLDLDYHVRHVCLPRPGTQEQLQREASRIMELPLDRSRPLWEIWLIEGLDAGLQFAVLSKIHHCMLDGAAGAELASILASPDPNEAIGAPEPYTPKPAPSSLELLLESWARRVSAPLRGARPVSRQGNGSAAHSEARERLGALRELASEALHRASPTPLNGRQGPHRSVAWLTLPLSEVLALKRALRCSVNDVVLGIVAGAVRRYLIHRNVDPARIDFRVSTPVNMRDASQRGQLGNFVSSWIVPLPVAEADAAARVEAICKCTFQLKQSRAALGVDTLLGISDWLPEPVVALSARAAAGPVNMIVTNVPGPQFPLYQQGSKLLGIHPLVPCLPRSGLGVAVFSYDGKLCWGFNADPDLVPDPERFRDLIDESFRELVRLASEKFETPRACPDEP